MPTITVNDEPRTFPDPITVADLLTTLGKDATKLAVEVNRDLVPRANRHFAPGHVWHIRIGIRREATGGRERMKDEG